MKGLDPHLHACDMCNGVHEKGLQKVRSLTATRTGLFGA